MQLPTRGITLRHISVLAGASVVMLLRAPSPSLAQVFKSGVDMVALTVTVTDDRGHSVSGLTAGDFAVYEDGVAQPIALFGGADLPLDVALVADASSSMAQQIPAVKDGAQALVARLRPGDRAAVIAVRTKSELAAPLSGDLDAVRGAIRGLSVAGSTALYDGVYLSLRQFELERRQEPQQRRQALVIFSDGVDNSSHVESDDIMALARALDVTIYTITLQQEPVSRFGLDPGLDPRWLMRTLSTETGGLAFFPTRPDEMRQIYDTIARELVSQYELAYVAPPRDDGPRFRRVGVRLVPPAYGVARTRTGYTKRPSHAGTQVRRSGE